MERHPTEQKILDEAIRIIENSGEASLRVHDIETAVGITAPSIYHFFGSREGLVSAAQAERILRSFAEFDLISNPILANVSSKAELREAIRELSVLIFDPSRATARLRRIYALGSTEGRPELAATIGEASRTYLRTVAESFRPFQEKGWVRPDLDLDAFSQWLAGQILGRVYIEIGAAPTTHPAWDTISADAVEFILFGPDPHD